MASKEEHEVIPMDEVDGLGDHQVDSAGLFTGSSPNVSHFTLSVQELKEIMEVRGQEAVDLISNKYGGIHNICKRLFTSENEGKYIYYPHH